MPAQRMMQPRLEWPADARNIRSARRARRLAPAVIETLENRSLLSAVSFAPQIITSVGNTPLSVVTGDFNHDGKLDAATGNYGTNTVSILLGNGDGTFKPQGTVTVGNLPIVLAAADLNGDGYTDLIVANRQSHSVGILMSNGDGTFQLKQTVMVGNQPVAGVLADVNGDGIPDLAVVNYGDGSVSILPGNSDGTFGAQHTVKVGAGANAIAAAKLDASGNVDLVTANYGADTLSVLQGDGHGNFTTIQTPSTGSKPDSVVIGDFNGDGPLDVAAANFGDGTITVFRGVGNGTFINPVTTAAGNAPISLVAADLNGNGTPDLVVSNFNQETASVMVGNGDGTFAAPAHFGVGALPFSVAVGDFNGDHKIDIVTTSDLEDTVSVLLNTAAAPAITSGNQTTFTTGAAGTFAITTSGSPTASLSETGTLPGGVTFTDNGNGTATITGTPSTGTGGTYLLTLNAANGVNPDGHQVFTLTVNQPPAITNGNQVAFVAGSDQTFAVTTTGFPAAGLTETGALPRGVSFTDNGNGTASIAGSAAAGTGGTYLVTLTASNGVGAPAVQLFTLTIDEAPAINSGNQVTLLTGHTGTFAVTSSGFPTASLTETGALPNGVSFVDNGGGSATLAGIPAAGTGGTYLLTLTADNGVAPAATQMFTLIVNVPVVPTVSTFTIDDGTAQRAMIRKLTVVFNEPVTLSAAAITLTLRDPHGGASTPQTFTLANPSLDQKTYILTFTGPGYIGGSLNDGVYDLVVHAGLVQDAGGNNPAADQTFSFYRLYGDYFGTGTVDFTDLVLLAQDFGAVSPQPTYLSFMDIDGDKSIGFAELVKLAQNFGSSLSVSSAPSAGGGNIAPLVGQAGTTNHVVNPTYAPPTTSAADQTSDGGVDPLAQLLQ